PIDGIVLNRTVEPGQTVAASLQAPVLFTIAEDLKKMEVQVDVDEADVGQVREGQSANFTVDAYPERIFSARIRDLRYGSETVQGVVTYKAVLETDNADLLLRPGMTATAEIIVRQALDVIRIPNAALRYTAEPQQAVDTRSFLQKILPGPPRLRRSQAPAATGPKRTIWVLDGGEAKPAEVVVGSSDGRLTELVEGDIEPGAAVIVDRIESGT
ncbi:MAG: efflux RND transporter periplasmic adaptor subunit, partial [Hyphomicrobiales bacterium]|nr:efflux RND transporter periplasmic adaptor subunit [Hyphomicrobiales bacterium]